MKKVLKVTFGAVLAVSMAAPMIASAHVHEIWNGIAVWGDATYMRQSNNGLSVGDYTLATTAPATFDGAHNHFFVDPDYEFDWALGVSYRLPHTHNRIFMSYDHFQNDVDRQGDFGIRALGLAPGAFTFAATELDTNAHEFRVGAIHDLHFGDHFCLDFKAFLEYARVTQTLNETIEQSGTVRFQSTENLIKGFGPGVGFVSRWYSHNPTWHIFAGANTTLLKVENEYSQTFGELVGQLAGRGYDYQPHETDSVVGKLDIEFGINWGCKFRHELRGAAWDVALGMKYMNMINVFKNGNTAYQVNGGANALPTSNNAPYLGAAQDWGKYGPFLRVKIGGANS